MLRPDRQVFTRSCARSMRESNPCRDGRPKGTPAFTFLYFQSNLPCDNFAPATACPFHGAFVMPKAYWVVCYRSISDPQKLAAYAKLAPAATAPFGARYLARGTAAAVFEAGLKDRVVITEFPSAQKAIDAYDSPAYKAALKALDDGAVGDVRIVEGLE